MNIRQTVLDRLAMVAPDCGDNSCRFAIKKSGMRTNGGCRCIDRRSATTWSPVEKLVLQQSGIIHELLNELEKYTGTPPKPNWLKISESNYHGFGALSDAQRDLQENIKGCFNPKANAIPGEYQGTVKVTIEYLPSEDNPE